MSLRANGISPKTSPMKKSMKKARPEYYIDLKELNRRQLVATGISPEKIEVSAHCTCCEPELFCSYRREGGTYRRMGAGLCML